MNMVFAALKQRLFTVSKFYIKKENIQKYEIILQILL